MEELQQLQRKQMILEPESVQVKFHQDIASHKLLIRLIYIASSYPWGQCTWFVFNRAKQLGITFDPYMGNGNQWMEKSGYSTTKTPTEHSALSFSSSQAGADPVYGHVAFVEQVKSDGSILISESNFKGLGIVSYRTFDAETAKQFTYVLGH